MILAIKVSAPTTPPKKRKAEEPQSSEKQSAPDTSGGGDEKKEKRQRKGFDVVANQSKVLQEIRDEAKSMSESLKKTIADAEGKIDIFGKQVTEKEEPDFFAGYVQTVENRSELVKLVVSEDSDAPQKLFDRVKKHQEDGIAVIDGAEWLQNLSSEFDRLSKSVKRAATEDDIKLVHKDLKEVMASFKRLLTALARATSDLAKAMDQKKKKLLSQAEKQRKQDEAQKKKAEKELQKQIKNAKGQQCDLPCMFMEAGIVKDMMHEIPVFDSVEALKAQLKAGGRLHEGGVYLLKNAGAMQAEVESVSGLKGFLQIFETQFPMSKQAKEKQRAQSQVKIDGMGKIKEAMMSCCSSRCTAFPSSGESPNVSLSEVFAYGFTSTMKFSGTEFLGMSSVRYSMKGEREVVVCSAAELWAILDPTQNHRFSNERIVTTVLGEKLWSSRLDEPWIQDLLKKGKADGSSKIFYKGVVPENSVLFLPAGVILCERALNNKVSIGLRMSVKDVSQLAKKNLEMLLTVHKTYAENNCKLLARWEDAVGA